MALYLVIHVPTDQHTNTDVVPPPTRMLELAREAGTAQASPKWVSTFSPDLRDDRIFSLWEADNADEISAALERYGFLNHMATEAIRVQQWGPADVIAAESQARS